MSMCRSVFKSMPLPLRIYHALLRACWPARRMEYAQWQGAWFTSVVVVRLPAGGRPAATYFSCFAKKSKQKKATQSRCPFGIPNCAARKMGNEANSLRSDSFISNPFSAPHNWQRHMRILVKSRVKSRVKSQFKSRFKTQVKSSTGLLYFDVLEHCVRGVTEVAPRMC